MRNLDNKADKKSSKSPVAPHKFGPKPNPFKNRHKNPTNNLHPNKNNPIHTRKNPNLHGLILNSRSNKINKKISMNYWIFSKKGKPKKLKITSMMKM